MENAYYIFPYHRVHISPNDYDQPGYILSASYGGICWPDYQVSTYNKRYFVLKLRILNYNKPFLDWKKQFALWDYLELIEHIQFGCYNVETIRDAQGFKYHIEAFIFYYTKKTCCSIIFGHSFLPSFGLCNNIGSLFYYSFVQNKELSYLERWYETKTINVFSYKENYMVELNGSSFTSDMSYFYHIKKIWPTLSDKPFNYLPRFGLEVRSLKEIASKVLFKTLKHPKDVLKFPKFIREHILVHDTHINNINNLNKDDYI